MAVRLRLMRIGKRNRPAYRICAVDARKPRGGAYIESIGSYNPFIEDDAKKVSLDKERAEYWLAVGASPSDTVLSFLRSAKVSGLIRSSKPKRRRKTAETTEVKKISDAKKRSMAKKASRKKVRKAKQASAAAGE